MSHPSTAELAELIATSLTGDGVIELRPGVWFYRRSAANRPNHSATGPSFCVIARGRKEVHAGDRTLRYDPAHYLISTLGGPATSCIIEATPEEPYLAFRLELDPAEVTSVMVETLHAPQSRPGLSGIDVSPLEDPLNNATFRLAYLAAMDNDQDYQALGPLVRREIIYRLLTGVQQQRMQYLAQHGGQAHRITRAVQRLQREFSKSLRVEDLAKEVGMSVSGFHAHFKTATEMTPLQYQKELRLLEARRLMLDENCDAAEAGHRVGYDDASYFSRDYKRHFNAPPKRDIAQLKVLQFSVSETS